MKVLISDTDFDVINEISFTLQQSKADCRFLIVNSGVICLDLIELYSIDLVFIGSTMVDMSGLDLVGLVRKLCNIPVIFISSNKDDNNLVSAFDAGANNYISLPFNREIFIAQMNATLRRVKWDGCKTGKNEYYH